MKRCAVDKGNSVIGCVGNIGDSDPACSERRDRDADHGHYHPSFARQRDENARQTEDASLLNGGR